MGTHISKVKSVDLDTWTPEQIANVQRWGNATANKCVVRIRARVGGGLSSRSLPSSAHHNGGRDTEA
ncbi:MAG: hypothetical protein BJ554DRAFT_1494 [Olpidium bornovanus]|uniref:Arf-GAP domain-containing protein n=1 Tax=Olpidium bornovanus TaxID=278681 RepID=A0A8H8DH19_9FUNG|nr:MAG: hypothetical protein BJ554DRAFT_1494 [Olpidium bornovanus]